jgi:hypothetical protein
MRRAILVLALLLLLAAPLVLVFRDLGRLVTLEAMRIALTLRLWLEGLPQLGLWVALLAVILATAVTTLAGRSEPAPGGGGRPADAPGQVWTLSRWVHRAAVSSYSRWTLSRYLEGLTWDTIAARHGVAAAKLRRRFRAGELALDPDIAAFLADASQRPTRPEVQLWAWLHRLLRGRAMDRPALPSLERIADYLEAQLGPSPVPPIALESEVEHAHDRG